MADADHFKQINDRFGHDGGDSSLQAIAAHLRALCGPSDHCARIGGEEFAVLLPDSDADSARALAARLVMQMPFRPDGEAGLSRFETLTLSVGGVALREEGTTSKLLALADRRLYQAKAAGRACAVMADPGTQGATERATPGAMGSAA